MPHTEAGRKLDAGETHRAADEWLNIGSCGEPRTEPSIMPAEAEEDL